MCDIWMDVDTALAEVPVNILPLLDDTDFKSREVAIVYNQAGMDLVWNFVTTAGAYTQTAVTPTTAGTYDWAHQGDGMYSIEIPASGGASINNDTEGYGWFTGLCTGVLPWRGPIIGFRAAGINDLVIDSPFSTTRGFAGTALPAVAAESAGGLYTRGSGAGQINQTNNGQIDANAARTGGTTNTGRDIGASVLLSSGTGTGQISLSSGAVLLQATQTGVTIPTVTAVTNQVTANVTGISGDTTAADNLEAALDGTGGVTITAALTGAITGNITGNLSGSVGSVTGAVGSVTGAVGSVTGAVGSVTGAVGSVTGNVGGNVVGSVGSVTTVSDKTGYRLSATGVDDVWDEPMSGHTTAGTYGDKIRAHAAGVLKALVTTGSTTTSVVLNATTGIDGAAPSSTNDFYNGRVIVFISGTLAGQATDITDYDGSTKALTVTALTSAPSSGDTAVIV